MKLKPHHLTDFHVPLAILLCCFVILIALAQPGDPPEPPEDKPDTLVIEGDFVAHGPVEGPNE